MSVIARWSLVRFVAPSYPNVNIYTRISRKMVSLGLIIIATTASKLWGWRVEIIDENNYYGPRDKDELPDHKKLQKENPADVVAFYCGLTCTMDRVFDLAKYYNGIGVTTIAGGKHVENLPEEALENSIDIVVFGEGELVIRDILTAIKENNILLGNIPNLAFLGENGHSYFTQIKNKATRGYDFELDNRPFPDYGLVKYARIKCYSIGRIRGCGMFCEFCGVRNLPRWGSPEYLFENVCWLVETQNARSFFIVDDRLEEDIEGYVIFFQLVRDKFGDKLHFTVQVRMGLAENLEFLSLMKEAGVFALCTGCESVIDQELKAMRKGYTSKKMLKWARTLRKMFWLHGMFIYRYPSKEKTELIVSDIERERKTKQFIKQSGMHSIQILQLVPLPGTEVMERLQKEGRLFPIDVIPWKCYDGVAVCYNPREATISDLQKAQIRIMKWFYSPFALYRIFLRTLIFPVDYLIRGWKKWEIGWLTDIVKYGGSFMVKRRERSREADLLIEAAEKYLSKKNK